MGRKIKVVIGANFGDEGKGLMTDYFCNQLSVEGNVLNVRYNGGAQAGHTVVTPDGKRHVFHHFGSGSFNPNVATFLSDKFIVNPILFCREWNELKNNFGIEPKVYISRNCRVTTPYDMLINQMVETDRGDNRHGSCGLGIYETVERCKCKEYHIDIRFIEYFKSAVSVMLRYIREYYVPIRIACYRIKDDGIDLPEKSYPKFCEWIKSDTIIENFVQQCEEMLSHCTIVDSNDVYSEYEQIVFEGSQGLLLSEEKKRYYPHVTASSTGSKIPMNEIKTYSIYPKCDLEVCYVTRSYFTRHGAGPLETECQKEMILPDTAHEKTNTKNEYQGSFRYGYFDKRIFFESILFDFMRSFGAKRSISVTHLDETGGMMSLAERKESPEDVCGCYAEKLYKSFGETRNDVCLF